MHPLHQITQQVNTPAADIRAEAILAQLLENGLPAADMTIRHQGQHRRPVRADLDNARVEQAPGNREQLAFYLNRDGMYDTLPEGMFHQPQAGNQPPEAAAMTAAYRIYKQEEQDARLLFAPLEQEFFLQKTFTEQKLQQAIAHIQHALPDDALFELLGINPALPLFFKSTLLRLLSHIPVIAGDITLLSEVFSLLLGQPARICQRLHMRTMQHNLDHPLGGATLGTDLVLGKKSTELLHQYQLTIGPVGAGELLYFFPGNTGAQCIQTLIRFLIPVTWELEVKITAATASQDGFVINGRNRYAGRLGYNIVLGKVNDTING